MARLRPTNEAAMAGPITFRDRRVSECKKPLRRSNNMKRVIGADLSRRSDAYLDINRTSVTIRNGCVTKKVLKIFQADRLFRFGMRARFAVARAVRTTSYQRQIKLRQ